MIIIFFASIPFQWLVQAPRLEQPKTICINLIENQRTETQISDISLFKNIISTNRIAIFFSKINEALPKSLSWSIERAFERLLELVPRIVERAASLLAMISLPEQTLNELCGF